MADMLWPMAGELLGCFCERLAATPSGPVCACYLAHEASVVPGDVWCGCDCASGQGQAWVRLMQAVLAAPAPRPGPCSHGRLNVTFELGSRRCVTVINEGGAPPDPVVLAADAERLAADAHAARQVVRCCVEGPLLGFTQSPIGPMGGCAGWTTQLTVGPISECGCK